MGTSVPRDADVIVNILDGSGVIVDDRGKVFHATPGHYYLLSAVRKMDFCADTSRLSLIYCVRGRAAEDCLPRQCVPTGESTEVGRLAVEVRKHINRSADDAEWQRIVRRLNDVVESSYPIEDPGVTCDPVFQNLLLHMHCGTFDSVRSIGLLKSLADFCGLSERSVQMKFSRFVGMTPMEYMRGIALDEARRILSDPRGTSSVRETASRLGFSNLGRFADQYLQRHGELPSATVRGVRSPL
jgi:AraC-like DNA-binding protein